MNEYVKIPPLPYRNGGNKRLSHKKNTTTELRLSSKVISSNKLTKIVSGKMSKEMKKWKKIMNKLIDDAEVHSHTNPTTGIEKKHKHDRQMYSLLGSLKKRMHDLQKDTNQDGLKIRYTPISFDHSQAR